jgi:(p)ppGpp synthase/HD superfamily hydrolase
VKLADRITNLAPPPAHWDAARISRYREEARQILDALGPAHEPLAQRLSRRIAEY